MEIVENVKKNVSKAKYFLGEIQVVNKQRDEEVEQVLEEINERYAKKREAIFENIKECLDEFVRLYADGQIELRKMENPEEREVFDTFLGNMKYEGTHLNENRDPLDDNEYIDALCGCLDGFIYQYEEDMKDVDPLAID